MFIVCSEPFTVYDVKHKSNVKPYIKDMMVQKEGTF